MIAPGAYERVRLGGVCAQPAFLLARNRLTRTAAERRFVLSGECGQVTVFRWRQTALETNSRWYRTIRDLRGPRRAKHFR